MSAAKKPNTRARAVEESDWLAPPVSRVTAREQVYGTLLDAIVSGALSPGAPLRSTWVSEKLGVSRTPVREAIERLIQEGLAIRETNGVVVVPAPSAEEIQDFFEIRGALEGLGARLAATDLDPAELKVLARTHAELRALVETDGVTPPVGLHLNGQFHDQILRMSGNRRLSETMRSLGTVVNRQLLEQVYIHADPGATLVDHQEILDMIGREDPEGAERAARLHVANAGELMMAFLREHSPLGEMA